MSVTISEPSALEELAAARLRGAKPEQLLQLSEAAIDQATAADDTLTLESIAAELDSAAATHPDQGDGLRLRFAAERAHAIASRHRHFAAADAESEKRAVPRAAKVAFRVTVASAALTLLLIVVMLAGQESDSSFVAFIVFGLVLILGSLVAAVTGVVGLLESVRTGSRKGMVMSAVPLMTVLVLIVVRVSLSF